MYYPYFRGKQFELITIRENAQLLATSEFVPIIEPVKESLRGLERSLKAICDASAKAIVIVNPHLGDHSSNSQNLSTLVDKLCSNSASISAGILLGADLNYHDAIRLLSANEGRNPTLVHAGFTDPRALAEHLRDQAFTPQHVFIEEHGAKTLYRKHFEGSARVLVRDGFMRKRNADYSDTPEEFSELHVTYADMNLSGFGDFLIVGDTFSETGGPAYAVAIHLTFIDPDKDDIMFIYHFVSDTNDTPTDPAGKFAQALKKLVETYDSGKSKLFPTNAIQEFRALHAKGHFPGLGYVKKLSMQHHIETLSLYLDRSKNGQA